MNDLRIEDSEQQTPYAGLQELGALESSPPLSAQIEQLRNIVLWLSKQQWPQPEEQTWEGLVQAYDKAMNPDPMPELPSRAYRVGR